MPNHVTNHLTVSGPKDDLLAFHNAINFGEGESNGIIRAFIPFPEELTGKSITNNDGEVVGVAFTDEGYAWCLNNWGTKWGDYDTKVSWGPVDTLNLIPGNEANPDETEWCVVYRYDTAWSPANQAILTISSMFPNLTFVTTWTEEGYQSAGAFIAHNGLSAVEYSDYNEHPDYPDWDDVDAVDTFHDAWCQYVDDIEWRVLRKFWNTQDALA